MPDGLMGYSLGLAVVDARTPARGKEPICTAARRGLRTLTSTKSQNSDVAIARQSWATWIAAAATATLGIPTLCPAIAIAPHRSTRPSSTTRLRAGVRLTSVLSSGCGQATLADLKPGNP